MCVSAENHYAYKCACPVDLSKVNNVIPLVHLSGQDTKRFGQDGNSGVHNFTLNLSC